MYPPRICSVQDQPGQWDGLWWLDPGPYATPRPGLATDPSPVAWALATGAEMDPTLVTFARSPAQPSHLAPAVVRPGVGRPLDLSGLRTVTGRLDHALVGGEARSGPVAVAYGTAQDGSGPVLWFGLLGGEQSEWVTASQVFVTPTGAGVPELEDGAPVLDEAGQRLFLLGHEWTDSQGPVAGPELVRNVLWALDLATGQWTRWGHIEVLGETTGASVTLDPVRRRLLVYGGSQGLQTLDRLVEVSLYPLSSRVLWDCGVTGACGGRAWHGATYDPMGHTLYVYGGERGGEPLAGGAAFDLLQETWWDLPEGGDEGPGARTRPVLRFDPRQGTLWLAGGTDTPEAILSPWELDPQRGTWLRRASLHAEPDGRAVGPNEPVTLLMSVDETVALPGQVRLVRAESTEPQLELRITGPLGATLAQDTAPGSVHEALLLGQPGERYRARVTTGPGYPHEHAVAVSLSDQEATLVETGVVHGLPGVTSVTAREGLAFVGHAQGVSVVDLRAPGPPAVLSTVTTGGLVQEVAPCGPHRVCAVQSWSQQDLVVLDVQSPAAPRVEAAVSLPGMCRSLAVREGLAYVACGALGVHVVSLLAPSGPVRADTLWLGGPVSEVKAAGRLLFAGLYGKRVKAFSLGEGGSPVLLAEARTARHPLQIRVIGNAVHVSEARGLGWALCVTGARCGFGQEVEVLQLDYETGTLDLVGSYDGTWRKVPYAASWRDRVALPRPGGLRVLQAEVSP
jgi:hypothetical protein